MGVGEMGVGEVALTHLLNTWVYIQGKHPHTQAHCTLITETSMGDELECLKEGVCTFLWVQASDCCTKEAWKPFWPLNWFLRTYSILIPVTNTSHRRHPSGYIPLQISSTYPLIYMSIEPLFFDYLASFPNILMPNICSTSACSMHIKFVSDKMQYIMLVSVVH